jgi:hypothetical protein
MSIPALVLVMRPKVPPYTAVTAPDGTFELRPVPGIAEVRVIQEIERLEPEL